MKVVFLLVALFVSLTSAQTGGGACTSHTQCLHGGTCTNNSCHCATNFTGAFCHTKCLLACSNGGTCQLKSTEHSQGEPLLSDYSCDCPTGWKGSSCTISYVQCKDGKQCLNGAVCAISDDSDDAPGVTYRCECDPDHGGDFCETIKTAAIKQRIQENQQASSLSSSSKKFSPGESVGIALGVGLAIGLLLGVGIMARRNSKGRPLREGMDAGALDADGSSTIQKVTTVGNAQKGHEDITVEEIEENEVI